jgi:hypothetical protein
MSHIPGHVIDPPKSPGTLRPVQNNQPCIDLIIRIPETYKSAGLYKSQNIGFHPYINTSGEVEAGDIVDWGAHEAAEAAFVNNSTLNTIGIQKLEDLYYHLDNVTELDKIEKELFKLGSLEKVLKDAFKYIRKNTKMFEKFYENGGMIRTPDEVVDKIREHIIYP